MSSGTFSCGCAVSGKTGCQGILRFPDFVVRTKGGLLVDRNEGTRPIDSSRRDKEEDRRRRVVRTAIERIAAEQKNERLRELALSAGQ